MKTTSTLSLLLIIFFTTTCFKKSTAQQWNLSGNNNATLGSKLGTTKAIPLILYTNNSPRMILTSTGRVGINMTPTNIFSVKSSGGIPASLWVPGNKVIFAGFSEATSSELILASASNTADNSAIFLGKRSRGTLASPAIIQHGDLLGSLSAAGFDGNTFQQAANINFMVDDMPSPGTIPTGISLATGNNSSDISERLNISSTGNFSFNKSQLFIKQTDGRIGIGTTTPEAKLDIDNVTTPVGLRIVNNYNNPEDYTPKYGIYASSIPAFGTGAEIHGGYLGLYSVGHAEYQDFQIGATAVYGESIGQGLDMFGVKGIANDGLHNIGVYGYAGNPGLSFTAAGYFEGDVYAGGLYVFSDRKLKTDIKPMENSLAQIMKLKPSYYSFKKDNYKDMGLSNGRQLGLIADEVKQVFPELVKEAVHTAKYDKDTRKKLSPEVKFEAVNYGGLIPVLVSSVQEQQKQIEDQQKQIDDLKEIIKQLVEDKGIKTSLGVSLQQNTPNPTANVTNIRYNVPENTKTAQLVMFDISGKTIRQIQLNSFPNGIINVDVAGLANGTYAYSIMVDGKLHHTRKMVVSKNQ